MMTRAFDAESAKVRRPRTSSWAREWNRPRTSSSSSNASVPADRRVRRRSLALTESGARVFVVCPQYVLRDEASYEVSEGVTIHRYPTHFSPGGASGYVREYTDALRSMRRLVRHIVSEHRIDVVHACNPPDILLLAAWAARRNGASFIFDQHDLVPEMTLSHFPGNKILHPASLASEQESAYNFSDVVLVTTDSYSRRSARPQITRMRASCCCVRNTRNLRPVLPAGRSGPELEEGPEC